MAEVYSQMAPYYDFLLSHVNYGDWYFYIKSIMNRYVSNPRLILEIGTGTGRFGGRFSSDGYTIYGMDLSHEMLVEADKRAFGEFRIFCADVRRFHLAKKFDFIFSVHDTMNYLLEYDELRSAFKNVHNIMHKDSIFMFDMTTEYNIRRYFDLQTEKFSFGKTRISWSNVYDDKKKHVISTLKFKEAGKKERVETHIQRIYTIDEVKPILEECGFEVMEIFADYTYEPVDTKTVMMNFIVRRK